MGILRKVKKSFGKVAGIATGVTPTKRLLGKFKSKPGAGAAGIKAMTPGRGRGIVAGARTRYSPPKV